ncbi:MAG: hypothetical protein V3V62_04510 [bacterium]
MPRILEDRAKCIPREAGLLREACVRLVEGMRGFPAAAGRGSRGKGRRTRRGGAPGGAGPAHS